MIVWFCRMADLNWPPRFGSGGSGNTVESARFELESLRDGARVYIGILAVEKSVGPDRHFVHEAEQVEFSVQRCRVAGDGEVRNGSEVLGDRIVAIVVCQRVRDAVQIAYGILI